MSLIDIYRENKIVEVANYGVMNWLREINSEPVSIQKALQAMLSKDKDTGLKIIDQIFSKSIFELYLTIIHDRLDLKNLIAENDLINELVCITL